MLVILSSLVALAAAPVATADPPKTEAAPVAAEGSAKSSKKKNENCVVTKKGRLFGHEITHLKCEDPKPAPKAA